MQAVESQTLILYHTDLRDHWPDGGGRALAAKLPYLKRLAVGSGSEAAHASLAGIALALRALGAVLGRPVSPGELLFAQEGKPRMEAGGHGADFSIAHSGSFVGCAALRGGEVGFDLEQGTDERLNNWVAREATVKAAGIGMRAVDEVTLEGSDAWCRGRRWYGRALRAFPGTTACLMTSVALSSVRLRALPLQDLFA